MPAVAEGFEPALADCCAVVAADGSTTRVGKLSLAAVLAAFSGPSGCGTAPPSADAAPLPRSPLFPRLAVSAAGNGGY